MSACRLSAECTRSLTTTPPLPPAGKQAPEGDKIRRLAKRSPGIVHRVPPWHTKGCGYGHAWPVHQLPYVVGVCGSFFLSWSVVTFSAGIL